MSQSEKTLFRKFPFKPRGRVATTVPGRFPSRMKGQDGQEFYGLRPYEYGDDSRKIHWKHYAKTGILAVREETAERNMRLWVFEDQSPSMRFGSKPELVSAFFSFAQNLAHEGNSIGIIGFSDKPHFIRKPKSGTVIKPDVKIVSGISSISMVLKLMAQSLRMGDVAFLLSDFLFTEGSIQDLRPFSVNQEIIPVIIRDPREKMEVGRARVSFKDMETEKTIHPADCSRLEEFDNELRKIILPIFPSYLWLEAKSRDEAVRKIAEWLYCRNKRKRG